MKDLKLNDSGVVSYDGDVTAINSDNVNNNKGLPLISSYLLAPLTGKMHKVFVRNCKEMLSAVGSSWVNSSIKHYDGVDTHTIDLTRNQALFVMSYFDHDLRFKLIKNKWLQFDDL